MIRDIDNFEFGWMNNTSNLRLNAEWIPGAYIKTQDDKDNFLSFDIEFNRESMRYTITHSIKLVYPWCSIHHRVDCGDYTTFKGERIKNREENIKSLIIDFFVGFYGSDKLLKKHFGTKYLSIKENYNKLYVECWNEKYKVTQNAVRQFAKDFCLV